MASPDITTEVLNTHELVAAWIDVLKAMKKITDKPTDILFTVEAFHSAYNDFLSKEAITNELKAHEDEEITQPVPLEILQQNYPLKLSLRQLEKLAEITNSLFMVSTTAGNKKITTAAKILDFKNTTDFQNVRDEIFTSITEKTALLSFICEDTAIVLNEKGKALSKKDKQTKMETFEEKKNLTLNI